MRLYKYLPKRFSNALLKRGSIRIGTLFDFRNSEHKKGISDATEGTKLINLDIGEIENYDYLTKTPDALKGLIEISGECRNISLGNIHMTRKQSSQDLFILCLSSEASKLVMNSLGGTDECLELVYQEEFFQTLNRIISLNGASFEGLYECTYQDRTLNLTSGKASTGQHSSLIKETEFSEQKEVRAIWKPNSDREIHPLTINNSNLGCFFRKTDI